MFLVYPNELLPNKVFFDRYYYVLFVSEFALLQAILGGMAMVARGGLAEDLLAFVFLPVRSTCLLTSG